MASRRPDSASRDAEESTRRRILANKESWHRSQAALPLRLKVEILLALQRQDLPLIARRRPLEPWERPWEIDP
jgi:hypothetical protein